MQITPPALEAAPPPDTLTEPEMPMTMPEVTAEMVLAILEANDLAHAGTETKEV